MNKFIVGIILIFSFICFSGAACRAASLGDDMEMFSKDSPQGYAIFCWQVAGFYQRSGNLPKALDWADRIIKIQPKNYAMQFYKAQLFFTLGKDKETENILEGLSKSSDLKDTLLLVSVNMLLYQNYKKQGKLQAKEKDAEARLKAKPVDIDTYRQLFMMYRTSESFDKTIDLSKNAIKAYPDESSFQLAMAYAYDAKGKNKDALREYKAYDAKYPGNLVVLFRIVDLHLSSGLLNDAASKLDKIEKDFSVNPQVIAQVKNYRNIIAAKKAKPKK